MLAPTFKDIVAAREFIDSPAQPTCKEVAEGAGAASLAAAIKIRDGLRGKKVVASRREATFRSSALRS